MLRQVVGVRRARHDGPVAWSGQERLQKASRDPDPFAARHLEHRVLRRESHHAIPGASSEAAAHVLFQTGPRPRQGVSDWLHSCNLKGPAEGVNW